MRMLTAGVIGILVVVGAIALRPRIARADLLKEGQIAPPFSTQMVTGDQQAPISLSDFHGRKVILYFYPKDETPGCTKEACAFRDAWDAIAKTGAVLIGVSADTLDSHKSFAAHHRLPFLLVSDPDGAIGRSYGVPFEGHHRREPFV